MQLCTYAAPNLMAQEIKKIERFQFSIPQQRADLSLIEIAERANVTLIFPYDDVVRFEANALNGQYTLEEALLQLLEGSDLKVSRDDKGQLTIELERNLGGIEIVHKMNKISAAILALASSTYPAIELSAQEVTQSETIEEVVVLGIRGSLQRAADVKRSSGGVVDAISSEDIGKFPDTNLAESLQRITGVSIDRSGGEGQFVTVRGFGPEFNTVLLNGRQMATDNTGREFSFDLLASELVSGVNVNKTSSAMLQSGGIGSTVNIKTARPLDIGGFKVAGSVKGVYDANSSETSPQYSALISNTFADGRFGALLSVSRQERKTRRNEVATDGWLENQVIASNREGFTASTANTFVPRNNEQRIIQEERTRTGGNLVLQFAPNDAVEITADALYSKFDVTSSGSSMGHWFTSTDFSNNAANPIVTDSNGTVLNFFQSNGATDFGARNFGRPSETMALGLNVDWQVNDALNLNFDYSNSNSEFNDFVGNSINPLIIFGFLDSVVFDHRAGNTLPGISGFEAANPNHVNEQSRVFGDGSVTGRGDYLDPSNVRSHVHIRDGRVMDDQIDQLKIDGKWEFQRETGLMNANFGVLQSKQEKSNTFVSNTGDGSHAILAGYFDRVGGTGAPVNIPQNIFSVIDGGSGFVNGVSGIENVPTRWLQFDQETAFAVVEQAVGRSIDAVPLGSSFEIEEDVTAAYVQLEFGGELGSIPFNSNFGVRYETTDVNVSGTSLTLDALTVIDQTELGRVSGEASPISGSASYSHVLPNLDLRLDFSDSLIGRFSASKTLTRPPVLQLAPAISITTTRQGGQLDASSGNPELEPLESNNLDLSLEWYYGDSSYASAGYFRKDVSNFIVSTKENDALTFVSPSTGQEVRDPSSPSGSDPTILDPNDSVARFDLTRPSNGEDATVDGFEFAVQHSFADTGFGVIANVTIVNSDSDYDINNLNQAFAVTGLSDSQNLVGYYENERFQIRLAWNNREGFLQSLTQGAGDGPTFVDDFQQWDISGSYDISDTLTVFFEGINITEEVVLKHGRYQNHFLLAEDTGARWALGVRGSF